MYLIFFVEFVGPYGIGEVVDQGICGTMKVSVVERICNNLYTTITSRKYVHG